jgi:hypothetical protein
VDSKEIEIDRCNVENENTALLSNTTTLNGQGKVNDMSLYLRVEDNTTPYVIDELYVQNSELGNLGKDKIISAA